MCLMAADLEIFRGVPGSAWHLDQSRRHKVIVSKRRYITWCPINLISNLKTNRRFFAELFPSQATGSDHPNCDQCPRIGLAGPQKRKHVSKSHAHGQPQQRKREAARTSCASFRSEARMTPMRLALRLPSTQQMEEQNTSKEIGNAATICTLHCFVFKS